MLGQIPTGTKASAFAEAQARLPTLVEAFNRLRPALLELKTGA